MAAVPHNSGSGMATSSVAVSSSAPGPAKPQLNPEQLGQMLLFFASAGNPLDVVPKLQDAVALGVDLVALADPFGNTLLHWACSRGCVELVQKLVELRTGADVNKANLATAHTPLHWACPEGNLKVCLLLLENGANPAAVDLVGRDPLFYAVANERFPLVHLLLLKGSPRETRDNGGNSALHWAAKTGNSQTVQLLLSVGFDANAQNNLAETPLHIAAREGKLAAFQVLLKFGRASIAIKNAQALTASEVAVGETKGFVGGEFKTSPHLYAPHEPYVFEKSMRQGAQVVALYVLGAYLLATFGWLLSLPLIGGAFYAWSRSRYWPAPDSYSSFSIVMIYTGYFLNMYLWYTRIRESELETHATEAIMFLVLSVLAFAVTQYLIWKVTDPGYVETAPEDDAMAFYEDVRRGILDFHICPTCRIRRPLRAKHDAVSNRCVYRFDHFCQFTNQPIGATNHSFFLLSLLFTCIHYTSFVMVSWRYLPAFEPPGLFFWSDPLLLYHFAQGCVYAAFMNYLLGNQLYHAATGYTTNEKIGQNTGKYLYLWRDGQRFSPFSRGSMVENLLDFFQNPSRYNSQYYLPGELPLTGVGVGR